MKVGDIPFEDLKIGDRVISCDGKRGVIAGLYPVGTTDPFGNKHDDWDGGILFLWSAIDFRGFSIAGYSELTVGYLGTKS